MMSCKIPQYPEECTFIKNSNLQTSLYSLFSEVLRFPPRSPPSFRLKLFKSQIFRFFRVTLSLEAYAMVSEWKSFVVFTHFYFQFFSLRPLFLFFAYHLILSEVSALTWRKFTLSLSRRNEVIFERFVLSRMEGVNCLRVYRWAKKDRQYKERNLSHFRSRVGKFLKSLCQSSTYEA